MMIAHKFCLHSALYLINSVNIQVMSTGCQENSDVRAAAFGLFGDLAAFGSGDSKEQFLDQIHTNFVSFLLHLNDHENQVRQVESCTLLSLAGCGVVRIGPTVFPGQR